MRRLPVMILLALPLCLAGGAAWAATEMPMSSDQPIHVVADRLEVDNQAQLASFIGAVKATQGDVTITSDKLEVYYDREGQAAKPAAKAEPAAAEVKPASSPEAAQGLGDEGGRVRKVVALGHVKITQKDRVAVGQKATYWAGGRKVLLEGQATVWRGPNQVSGEQITVFLDEDRSVVHGQPGKRVSVTIVPEKAQEPDKPGKPTGPAAPKAGSKPAPK